MIRVSDEKLEELKKEFDFSIDSTINYSLADPHMFDGWRVIGVIQNNDEWVCNIDHPYVISTGDRRWLSKFKLTWATIIGDSILVLASEECSEAYFIDPEDIFELIRKLAFIKVPKPQGISSWGYTSSRKSSTIDTLKEMNDWLNIATTTSATDTLSTISSYDYNTYVNRLSYVDSTPKNTIWNKFVIDEDDEDQLGLC